MECVIDTSALSWLERVGYVDLLPRIYQKIIAPPGVLRQLKNHYALGDFLDEYVKPLHLVGENERRRLRRLTRRWQKKEGIEDSVDAEVFVAYRFFTEANEAVYANKGAEEKLSKYGHVRDIGRLYELAESQGVFTRDDSLKFLHTFLRWEKPYREPYIQRLLSGLVHK